MNGQGNVVREGLYLKGINNIVELDNKHHALLYLLVHCYLYYLAEREDANCIPDIVRQSAQDIIKNKKVKNAFIRFLDMLSENAKWLDLDVQEQMYCILNKYELFSEYDSVKTVVIEYSIRDFYTFILLFMNSRYYLPELLENNIDDMSSFRYVSNGNEENTKTIFNILFRMISIDNKTEEKIKTEVDLMYNSLEQVVKKKQKARYIEKAKKDQEKYKDTINKAEICELISHNVMNKIKEKFRPILIDEDKKNGTIKIKLLQLDEYTDFFGKKSIDGYYTDVEGTFLHGVLRFLCKRNIVEFKNRFDDFIDDLEYMEYLRNNDFDLLLGSQFVLSNRDYKLSGKMKQLLNNYETIYTSLVREGVALKKGAIYVCLHNVNVSIHSPNIREEQGIYNKETGKYIYSIMEGLPIDFEENELREFLYNNRKIRLFRGNGG